MSSTETGIEGLNRAGYALELLGEAITIEAREVRHAAQVLSDRAASAREVGQDFTKAVAVEAAAQKLNGDVEAGVRYQRDAIRQIIASLLSE